MKAIIKLNNVDTIVSVEIYQEHQTPRVYINLFRQNDDLQDCLKFEDVASDAGNYWVYSADSLLEFLSQPFTV
jgi:hypothetical protein